MSLPGLASLSSQAQRGQKQKRKSSSGSSGKITSCTFTTEEKLTAQGCHGWSHSHSIFIIYNKKWYSCSQKFILLLFGRNLVHNHLYWVFWNQYRVKNIHLQLFYDRLQAGSFFGHNIEFVWQVQVHGSCSNCRRPKLSPLTERKLVLVRNNPGATSA